MGRCPASLSRAASCPIERMALGLNAAYKEVWLLTNPASTRGSSEKNESGGATEWICLKGIIASPISGHLHRSCALNLPLFQQPNIPYCNFSKRNHSFLQAPIAADTAGNGV